MMQHKVYLGWSTKYNKAVWVDKSVLYNLRHLESVKREYGIYKQAFPIKTSVLGGIVWVEADSWEDAFEFYYGVKPPTNKEEQ